MTKPLVAVALSRSRRANARDAWLVRVGGHHFAFIWAVEGFGVCTAITPSMKASKET